MSAPIRVRSQTPIDVPVTPDEATWGQMSPEDREQYLADALAALQAEHEQMAPEGQPHFRSKTRIRRTLGDHFDRIGRDVYLACESPVHYPGRRPFAPDLFAVLDVEDPGDDDARMAWVVADEGKGLDLVLEVLHAGDPAKDLVDNVLLYASLGICEYFVYDRRRMTVQGFALPSPDATRYEPIASRAGSVRSRVLGLEMGIYEGHLRFFYGGAVVPETKEILARVSRMVAGLEGRIGEAEREAVEAQDKAMALAGLVDQAEARAEQEAQRAEQEAQRAEQEAQRAEQEAQRAAALEAEIAALKARLGE